MLRHAYLLLVHTNPSQVRTLVGMLDDSRNDIFIHIDRSAGFGPAAIEGSCSKSSLYFTDKRISVHWGGVSIMRAELELLHKAVSTGPYAYYHLLSGMDLPIKSQDEIHSFFDAHSGCEFIDCWTMKPTTPSRFRYYTLFPEGCGFLLTNALNNAFKGLMMMLGLKINRDVDFKFAAQWFSITDALARYVLAHRDWLEKTFRHTNTCDEIFLPTLVWDSPFRDRLFIGKEWSANSGSKCVNGNMRFIDWTRGKSIRHPWTFTKDDFDLLKSVPHLWARKFDARVDSEIIEMVAESIGCRTFHG